MKTTRGIIDRNEVVYDPGLMIYTAYFHGFAHDGREETSSCASERYIEARRWLDRLIAKRLEAWR